MHSRDTGDRWTCRGLRSLLPLPSCLLFLPGCHGADVVCLCLLSNFMVSPLPGNEPQTALKKLYSKRLRTVVKETGLRCDGRKTNEVRTKVMHVIPRLKTDPCSRATSPSPVCGLCLCTIPVAGSHGPVFRKPCATSRMPFDVTPLPCLAAAVKVEWHRRRFAPVGTRNMSFFVL